MFSSEEESERQERGQTTVSSGGVWLAPSAKVEVRVKAFFHEGFFAHKKKALLSRQITLRSSCPTFRGVYVE